MRLRSAALALLLLLCTAILYTEPPSSRAGTAERLDVAQLVQGSSLVVTGLVLESRAILTPTGRIDTEYTLDVERTFWGAETSLVRLPGGVLPDGRGMVVPGMPRLEPGHEVLLTLSAPAVDGLRMPVGLSQGCFHLLHGDDGHRLATRSAAGAGLVGSQGSVGEGSSFAMDYGELVAEVVRAVEERRARGEESGK